MELIINQLAKDLAKLPFVKQIILFGSRARGDSLERADIDIAVDCPGSTDAEWQKVIDIIDEAPTLLKIDCVRYDRLSQQNELRQAIQKEGISLFEREKS